MSQTLLHKAKTEVEEFYSSNDIDAKLDYHNWKHTANVFEKVQSLARESGLRESELQLLALAALYHDIDYINGREGHEERSAQIALKTLKELGLSDADCERVADLIRVTEMKSTPANLMEELMKDADTAHLGQKDYLIYYNALHQELEKFEGEKLSPQQWKSCCIDFFEQHVYHSDAGKKLFSEQKNANKRALMEQATPAPSEKGGKKKKKAKTDIPEKGIETMFRVSLRNHINLSRMADDKANTLISVNAIILSIVLSALFPKLDSNPFLLIPGLLLISISITTIIIATFSTLPRTTQGHVSKEDVKQKKGNLLFFGNFHSMSLEDYEWGIGEVMKDREYLYNSMKRDLFFLGKVLDKKYRLLRYAYIIFVVGLIVSILSFVYKIMTLETPPVPI